MYFSRFNFRQTVILLWSLKNRILQYKVKFKWKLLKINWNDIIEPSVLPAAIVMFLSTFSSGIVLTITPDMSDFFNIENKGWFLGFYAFSTIFIRILVSGLSDRIGRQKTLIFGLFIMSISMMFVTFSSEWKLYTIGAILFGISTGISSPTLMAWTADLSHKQRRGIGASTLFIALELGIMFGSASTIFTYGNTLYTTKYSFIAGSIMAIIGIIYLIWHLKYRFSKR